MRKSLVALMTVALVLGALSGARAGKPAKVWEDPTGDADNAQGVGQSIPGGFDLTEGSIVRDGDNIVFTVTHADMPPMGSLPEAFRFLWAFAVDDEVFRLTVKSADIGKPDAGQNQTTERLGRADLMGHFRLEGECGSTPTPAANFINCSPIEYLEGSFDAGAKTFTFPVPMELIGARPKSVIAGGGGDAAAICQICWVSHVAERSHSYTLIDTATQIKTYKVPK